MEPRHHRYPIVLGLILIVPAVAVAQTDARKLAGCFRFEADAADSTSLAPGQGFLHDIQFVQPADSGQLRLLDQPQASDLSRWEAISADSAVVSVDYGFSGVVMQLKLTDGLLRGTAAEWTDGMDPSDGVTTISVTGRPTTCPTETQPR